MQVLAARLAGCRRLVMTIHNDEPFYRTPAAEVLVPPLVASGVRFVAITEHLRQYLVTAVRPSPGERDDHRVRRAGARRTARRRASELGLADSDFVVGFVGRLTRQKNIQLLIRAMALRPDVTCVVVGEGQLRAELEELARTLDCSNVRFIGAQPDAARLMPLFDVFCLPSMWEGLGVVLLEAMLQDVPIVGSRAGAIPEVLDRGTVRDADRSRVRGIARQRHRHAPRRSCAPGVSGAAREHRAASTYAVQRMGDGRAPLR